MLKSKLLDDVDAIIHGARQESYGDWDQNFQDIADIWNIQLRGKLQEQAIGGPPMDITPRDVAMMMAALKLMRDTHAPLRDNLVDGAGYLAIADALSELGTV